MNIGILSDSDELTLQKANAHEFGAHIVPKNSKYLTIPLGKEYASQNARNVSGLSVYKSKNGNLFLVKNKWKENMEFCYFLANSIDIPERSFIRAGFDKNKNEIEDMVEQAIAETIEGQIDMETFYEKVGIYCVGKIQEYLIDLDSPPLSPLTLANRQNGGSNPLVDTHQMNEQISYKVV